MKHLIVLGLAAAAASSAQAVELYDNGPVVDGSGLSVLSSLVQGTFGVTSNAGFALADNFTVAGPGWNVEGLDFFAYQTNGLGFTFTSVSWTLRSGTDVNTAALVASGDTAVTDGGLVGYRVTDTTLTNTQRAIYRISADIPDVTLAAGNYFVTWALSGTAASGPFVSPVLGTYGIADGGLQSPIPGTFTAVSDGSSFESFDLPFAVQGSLVPEPGTWAMMLAGGLAVAGLARRRKA